MSLLDGEHFEPDDDETEPAALGLPAGMDAGDIAADLPAPGLLPVPPGAGIAAEEAGALLESAEEP